MNKYCVFGLGIETDLVFRQLVAVEDIPTDVLVVSGTIPDEVLTRDDRKYEFGESRSWLQNNTCWLLIENGNKITYLLKDGGNPGYLCTYILGWGMSMLALQRGTLAMHCSAVADEKGAVLICGESGAGKSTVTTAFLERGYRLMADDMSFVETDLKERRTYASPAFPYQKLCRDVALSKGFDLEELIYIDEMKDKYLVPYKGEFLLDSVPVRGMIVLGATNKEEVESVEVTGLQLFHMVANNLFLRHLLGKDKYEPKIGKLCLDMASTIKAQWIGRPLGRNTVDEVIEKVFTAVEDRFF